MVVIFHGHGFLRIGGILPPCLMGRRLRFTCWPLALTTFNEQISLSFVMRETNFYLLKGSR